MGRRARDRPLANRWLEGGRPFRGLILWPQEHYKRMGYRELVSNLEALSEPFPHPVIHVKPLPWCG